MEARRGVIYDANNNVLASSEPVMSVNVYLNEVEDREKLAENLAELFNREDIYTAEEEARAIINESSVAEAVENNARLLNDQAADEEEQETSEDEDSKTKSDKDSEKDSDKD